MCLYGPCLVSMSHVFVIFFFNVYMGLVYVIFEPLFFHPIFQFLVRRFWPQVENFKNGDKIITEGEPGDKFYIVEAGYPEEKSLVK